MVAVEIYMCFAFHFVPFKSETRKILSLKLLEGSASFKAV